MPDNFLSADLFKRLPTNDEKAYYREQWGGVHPWRCFFGMVGCLFIGFMVGLAF